MFFYSRRKAWAVGQIAIFATPVGQTEQVEVTLVFKLLVFELAKII